jgi:protein SCO1/2
MALMYRIQGRRHVNNPLAFTAILTLAACCGLFACQWQRSTPQQRYELTGKVVAVDPQRRLVTIAHEKIEGYMDAMTMPFSLKDEWAYTVLAAGDRVGAVLVVEGDRSWLEEISITKDSHVTDTAQGENQQQALTTAFEPFPAADFTLTDQDGQPFTLSSLQGKVVLIDFIFTSCPGPCPLLSLKFSQLQQRLGERLGKDVMLLSVTIDPKRDTPAVLKDYAQRYQADLQGWKFLTGSTRDIIMAATAYGADYQASAEGIVDHRLVTCLIDRTGLVVQEFAGTNHTVEDLMAAIERTLTSQS